MLPFIGSIDHVPTNEDLELLVSDLVLVVKLTFDESGCGVL